MRHAADCYFADGSIAHAVPPLHALLHIMRDGAWQGHDASAPEVRRLFSREVMLQSEWYAARLEAQQRRDLEDWTQRADYLEKFLARPNYADVAERCGIREKLAAARAAIVAAQKKTYLNELVGTLGLDPSLMPAAAS